MLQPKFLKTIDSYLLLKFPLVWSSRIHYVAWYTLLCWVFMGFVSFLVPNEDINSDFLQFYFLLVSLSCLGGLIIWLVFLSRHNSMKQYGNRLFGGEWVSILCNYGCIILISSLLFMLPVITVFKAHIAIQANGIVEKVNILNTNRALFPGNDFNYIETVHDPYNNKYERGKQAIKMKNETTYKIFADYRNYPNQYGHHDYKYLDREYLTSDDCYFEFKKVRGRDRIDKACRDYIRVAHELGVVYGFDANKIPALINDSLGYSRDSAFEANNELMNEQLSMKTTKYFKAINTFGFLFESLFYSGWLFISVPILLIFITLFRNLGKQFVLASIGITILLVIVNALLLFLVMKDEFENTRSMFGILELFFGAWTAVLLLVSISVYFQRSYSKVSAYCVFLFNLALPFLPAIFMELSFFDHSSYMVHDYENSQRSWDFWMHWAHIGGLLLFLAMQQFFFKPLYERLWALPK